MSTGLRDTSPNPIRFMRASSSTPWVKASTYSAVCTCQCCQKHYCHLFISLEVIRPCDRITLHSLRCMVEMLCLLSVLGCTAMRALFPSARLQINKTHWNATHMNMHLTIVAPRDNGCGFTSAFVGPERHIKASMAAQLTSCKVSLHGSLLGKCTCSSHLNLDCAQGMHAQCSMMLTRMMSSLNESPHDSRTQARAAACLLLSDEPILQQRFIYPPEHSLQRQGMSWCCQLVRDMLPSDLWEAL